MGLGGQQVVMVLFYSTEIVVTDGTHSGALLLVLPWVGRGTGWG